MDRRSMLAAEDAARAAEPAGPGETAHAGRSFTQLGTHYFPGVELPSSYVGWPNVAAMRRGGYIVFRVPRPNSPKPFTPRAFVRQPLVLPSKLSGADADSPQADELRSLVEAELRNGAEDLATAIDRSRQRNFAAWDRALRASVEARSRGNSLKRQPPNDRALLAIEG